MRTLAIAMLLLAGCRNDGRYLGNNKPPSAQRLVYINAYEPTVLDPAGNSTFTDLGVQQCLFEGLTIINPVTSQPMAGMATHYEVTADGEQYTFYLRGHPHPKGNRLDDISVLPTEFSHGVKPPPDSTPARWSDGSLVTAADFLYSLRRLVDPRTASSGAGDAVVILHAREITAREMSPDQLGVEAPDEFTLRVRLQGPAPYFLGLVASPDFLPVPRQAIQRAVLRGLEDTWTRPGNIVTNGPFDLTESRAYDHLTTRRSRTYYESDLVKLGEITFANLGVGPPAINFYLAGFGQSMVDVALPTVLIPALRQKRDLRVSPELLLGYLAINMRRPPFDNRMLRWALNMALDKRAIAAFQVGRPARQLIPDMPGFAPPESVMVEIQGRKYDVLAYDPAGARELLARAGYPGGIGLDGKRLTFPINTPGRIDLPQIISHQWLVNLNIEAQVNLVEAAVLSDGVMSGTLPGLTLDGWGLNYADPIALLGPAFTADWLGWHDEAYTAQLTAANGTLDPSARMQKLSRCAALLMEAMPLIPFSFRSDIRVTKPYVRALETDLLGNPSFRYTWIDTGWKP
jgi:ABC-type oligopeptide transport system substrate-binding subunit